MNRPKKKDYPEVTKIINGVVTTYTSDNYTKDLDQYCDKLEKALDAACYMLERFDNICHSIYPMTKEQWKKRLMNDDWAKSIILRGIKLEKE